MFSFRSIRLLAFLVVFSGILGSPRLIAADGIAPCEKCKSTGHVLCSECRGAKFSNNVPKACPDCEGEKTVSCTHCDEKFMMDCAQKRSKTINGQHMVMNPAWMAYMKEKQKRLPMGIHSESEKDDPDAPVKWLLCPACQGSGKVRCAYCHGTKKMKCPKCDGVGTVNSRGPCLTCHGLGEMPCEACAVLPEEASSKNKEQLEQLLDLLNAKLIDTGAYWQRRRILVAEAKDTLAAARLKKTEGPSHPDADTPSADELRRQQEQAEMKEREKTLDLALAALDSGTIEMATYVAKRHTLGLSEDAVRTKELLAAEKSARIKALVTLEDKFRDGKIAYGQYLSEMEKLKK